MTCLPLANRIFVKVAALVFVAALTAVPSHAQTQDFEIMVSGPWQFVAQTDLSGNDRLVVVTPYDVTHVANFWSGTDASMSNWMNSKGDPGGEAVINQNGDSSHPNIYRLDFLGGTRDKSVTTYGRRESVYETTTHVLPSAIYKVLSQPSTPARYAISLPAPDYVRTYSGTKLRPGTAEAEISNTVPDGSASPALYATWTVLHYGFQGNPPSGMSVMVDALKVAPVLAGTVIDGHNRYGISISLVEAPLCDDQTGGLKYYPGYGVTGGCDYPTNFNIPVPTSDKECDVLSGFSFALSAELWGLGEYARFPEEKDARGNQDFGNYDYDDCSPYNSANVANVRSLQQKVARHNFAVADTAKAIEAIQASLEADIKVKSAKPAHRSKLKEAKDSPLSVAFGKIATGLELLFPQGIPAKVVEAYYCVCKDTAVNGNSCPQLTQPSETTLSCSPDGQPYLKTIEDAIALDPIDPTDKGSADCHSPQISINGAIQPQP